MIEIAKGTFVADVRRPDEFESGHFPGAVNIPVDEVESRLAEFPQPRDQKIVVYCHSGRRSGLAKQMLEKAGYKDVINGGGLRDMPPDFAGS